MASERAGDFRVLSEGICGEGTTSPGHREPWAVGTTGRCKGRSGRRRWDARRCGAERWDFGWTDGLLQEKKNPEGGWLIAGCRWVAQVAVVKIPKEPGLG